MKFLPYNEISAVPNVIVDGKGTDNTVLTLSHSAWNPYDEVP